MGFGERRKLPNGSGAEPQKPTRFSAFHAKKSKFWALVNLLFLGDQTEVKVPEPRSVKECVILFCIFLTKLKFFVQWRCHTRACQGKCSSRNTSALAVKSGNNKVIYMPLMTCLCPAMSSGKGVARGQMGTDVPGRQTRGGAKIGLE